MLPPEAIFVSSLRKRKSSWEQDFCSAHWYSYSQCLQEWLVHNGNSIVVENKCIYHGKWCLTGLPVHTLLFSFPSQLERMMNTHQRKQRQKLTILLQGGFQFGAWSLTSAPGYTQAYHSDLTDPDGDIKALLPKTKQALRVKPSHFIRSTYKTIKQTIPISHILELEILEKLLHVMSTSGLLCTTRDNDCFENSRRYFKSPSMSPREGICWPHTAAPFCLAEQSPSEPFR